MKSVCSLYKDGRPLHHLPSARSKLYDLDASAIFVVDYGDYRKMKAERIQAIFLHRHIFAVNVPTEDIKFDEAGLSTMGALDQSRQVQGKSQLQVLHWKNESQHCSFFSSDG